MEVAVYRSPGEVAVEERPVPVPAAGQVLVEVATAGSAAPTSTSCSKAGASPGLVGSRVQREWSPRSAPAARLVGRATGRRRRLSPLRRCRRCLEGKPSQCESRRRRSTATPVTARSPATSSATPVRCCDSPTGCRPGWRRWPSPWRWRCTASRGSGIVHGDTAMVFGAGPIGALTIAALVGRWDWARSWWSSPASAADELAADSGAAEVLDPVRARDLPAVGARAPVAARRRRGARVLGQEGGHGGRLLPAPPWRAPGARRCGHRGAELRPQPDDPQRAHCAARSSTTRTGSSGPWSCLGRGGCRSSCSSIPTTSHSKGSARPAELAGGRIAGKVMVVAGGAASGHPTWRRD